MSQTGQSQIFDLPSGAKLAVTVAPFRDAWSLMKASLSTLKGMELKGIDVKQKLSALVLNDPKAIELILDRVVDFATSPEVEAAMWKCAKKALYIPANSDPAYPGTEVNQNMFDEPSSGEKVREDYARIVFHLLEVNCKPFLAQALSSFTKPKTENPSPAQK